LPRARRLGETLGPILWQLPPNWRANLKRLETSAKLLPSDLTHVFEFRDQRWFVEPVRQILEKHNLTFCISDMPGLPCPDWITSDVVYLRFHGSERVYGGLHGREGLRPWVKRISAWRRDGHYVYAYFNNDAFGYAGKDAQTLRETMDW
jgi:uncharacterized protein YecE (DUF72 family)